MHNSETVNFIEQNINSDIKKLLLAKRTDSRIDYEFAFRQIEGLQRIKHKVPTFYNTKDIHFPPHLNIEQSSSESTALYKKNICEGSVFIDITGGFGIDTYFISRGFEKAIYIERNEELCRIAEHNFAVLGAKNVIVKNTDSTSYISEISVSDCILADPARRSKSGGKTVFLEDCEPDMTILHKRLLEKTKLLMIKLSPMLDITAAINSLSNIKEVHVLSVENECKEILLLLAPNYNNRIKYYAVNILKNGVTEFFEFSKEEEQVAICNYVTTVSNFLYEPNSSVLKAGAFKMIAKTYNINKLHKNTHLYSSNELIPDFPGRSFEVIRVWKNNKKELSELKNQLNKANISTRNYPLKPEELKKKTGIADGGDTYLFGCTLHDETKVIVECRKITSAI